MHTALFIIAALASSVKYLVKLFVLLIFIAAFVI